jgi:hypothetical protein
LKVDVIGKSSRAHSEMFREAASVEDAYNQGLFGSGMPFDEFCGRILKPNPALKIHRGPSYTGLFDVENNKFVCGISRFSRIPRFTIMKHDMMQDRKINYSDEHGNITSKQTINTDDEKGKVLCRSWISVFNLLKGQGYEVDDEDIDY